MLLDTTHNIATPEGVELRLPVAGLAARALAWLFDAIIKVVAMTVGATVLAFLNEFGEAVYLIGLFALLWFYNVLFEVFNQGATPGKALLGLKVVNQNGTPVGWSGSLIRNLIRFVDLLPGCYAFGCVSVLLSKNFQRLGDLAAGTLVVYKPKAAHDGQRGSQAPVAVKVPLSLEEQQAIVSFGERTAQLTEDRATELAEIVAPVFGTSNVGVLQGHANWLAGRGQNR